MEISKQAEEPRFIDGEYIVIFEEQWNREISEQVGLLADQLREEILQAYSIHQDSVLNRYRYAIKGFAAALSDEQAEALKNDPRIARVTPNALLRLASSSATTNKEVTTNSLSAPSLQFGNWGVSRLGGPLDGTGLTAWILDTGIDLDHPDLNVDVQNSASFIANEPADDGNGHGTHVAGIVASTGQNTGIQGMAAGATVVAIKVCHDDPNLGCPINSIVDGIDFIAIRAEPEDIVNMSLGGPDPNEQFIDIDNAVINAANNGIRFSIAAGNESMDAVDYTPARVVHQNTWTVSAYRQGDEFVQIFDWNTPNCNPDQNPNVGSNFGNPPVNYSAPGENILSLWRNGGTRTTCGTSMAAPHVAGILLATGDEPLTDGTVSNDPDGNPDPVAVASIQLSAPFIFASVNNDHPHLSWSAVTDAESYRIYRRIEQGSWQWIGSVSTTSFTDWTQSSPTLSVISSPNPNWDNTLGYRVKATSSQSGYEDSHYSNTVYFSTDGSCNPCP